MNIAFRFTIICYLFYLRCLSPEPCVAPLSFLGAYVPTSRRRFSCILPADVEGGGDGAPKSFFLLPSRVPFNEHAGRFASAYISSPSVYARFMVALSFAGEGKKNHVLCVMPSSLFFVNLLYEVLIRDGKGKNSRCAVVCFCVPFRFGEAWPTSASPLSPLLCFTFSTTKKNKKSTDVSKKKKK